MMWSEKYINMATDFFFFFLVKQTSSLDHFCLVKTGTDIGLPQRWNGVMWTFGQWGIPV